MSLLVSQPARRPVRQINYQASIDLGMLQQVRSELQCVGESEKPEDFPDCEPGVTESSNVDNSVERFIAVPISATEQYLISSTGQTYITEKLSSPITTRK